MKRDVGAPLAGATIWAALLIPAAFVLVKSSTHLSYRSGVTTVWPLVSLVRVNGLGVLGLVAVPLVLSLAVSGLLFFSVRHGSSLARGVAWTISLVVLAGALLGTVTFLIGIYVVPTGVLLVLACLNLRRGRAVTDSPVSPSHVVSGVTSVSGHRNDVDANYCVACGQRL